MAGPRVNVTFEAASAGVGRHVTDLIERLSQREVAEFHVLWSPIRADQRFIEQLDRPDVYHQAIPMQRSIGPSDLASLAAVRNYLKIHGPFDIVHGHSSKGGALARLAALGTGSRVVYTPHAFAAMDPACGRLKRLLYRRLELDLAQQNLQVLQAQFQQGRASVRDLESAQLDQNDKWLAFLDADFARQQAQLDLLRTTGQVAKLFQ